MRPTEKSRRNILQLQYHSFDTAVLTDSYWKYFRIIFYIARIASENVTTNSTSISSGSVCVVITVSAETGLPREFRKEGLIECFNRSQLEWKPTSIAGVRSRNM